MIDLDEDDYKKGVEEVKYNMIGKLYFPKHCVHPTIMEIKK